MKFKWKRDDRDRYKGDINLFVNDEGHMAGWVRPDNGFASKPRTKWIAAYCWTPAHLDYLYQQCDTQREAMRWLRQRVLMHVLGGGLR